MKTKDFPSVIAAGRATAKQLESRAGEDMKKSPWFNAMLQPPVNGGNDALYEHRCLAFESQGVTRERKSQLLRWAFGTPCPDCQWRGMLKEKK